MNITADQFFELPNDILYHELFCGKHSPITWLDNINSAISLLAKNNELMKHKDYPIGSTIDDSVFIHKTVKLPPICVINGPAYIGAYTEIRPFAYIRENVVIGEHCLIGNSTELKNTILLNHVQVPHFNYVGDSILGNHSHLGAGVILANLRLDQANVKVSFFGEKIDTGKRKFGAILGDHVEIGCNSVLNPGCVVAKNNKIRSNISLCGYIDSTCS